MTSTAKKWVTPLTHGRLIARYRVLSPAKTSKGKAEETGYALKYDKEPFYRLFIESPEKSEFLIMPGSGGMRAAFKVFIEIRDPRTNEFITFGEAGSGDWSYDRKGIYVRTTSPPGNYIIIFEPSNFPFWGVNAE